MTPRQRFWAILHKVLPYWALRRVCELCDEFGFDPRDRDAFERLGNIEWTVGPGRRSVLKVDSELFVIDPARTFATGASVTYTFKP